MEQSILEKLDAHDWVKAIIRLSGYVRMLCSLHGYTLPVRMEEVDIVMDAIEKVYSGKRKWNPDADPDLEDYMKSTIKSMISNSMGKAEILTVDIEKASKTTGRDAGKEEEDLEELNARISSSIDGDAGLAIVFKSLKDGLKPVEMEKEYGIHIEKIRNAQKRLRRIVLEIVTTLKEKRSQ